MIMILSFVMMIILVSCAKTSQEQTNQESPNNDSDKAILIAYFSWSGHTKQLASEIQKQAGGDLFEIQTKELYTDDINVLSGQALQELQDDVRPQLSSHVDDIAKYDIIFVGYPSWWSNMPMPLYTF